MFWGFSDIENSVQILCKKTILPSKLEKLGFGASNRNGVNIKVVEVNEISQTELKKILGF